MRVDLHNHTTLCNHAEGTMEAYVLAAIEQKIDVFGFSDHAPMDFDQKYRMSMAQREGYEEKIRELAAAYKDKITILTAYEVDYLPGYMEKAILEAEVDYLIGSVHFLDEWGFDNPEFIGEYENREIDDIWKEYFSKIAAMADTRLFQVVGHLDLIKVFAFFPKGDVTPAVDGALEAIRDAGMVLEVSSAGLRKKVGEAYPSREILRKAFDLGIGITFGCDAHSPAQVGWKIGETEALARSVGYDRCALFRKKQREMVRF